jgi:Raf kinase inhibitor-like YbhB/YbcL family protein
MKKIVFTLLIISFLFSQDKEDTEMSNFSITSDAFDNHSTIPIENTCEGLDKNPPLKWKDFPEGTKSYSLTCVDPDAPMGDWIHWLVWNIPADFNALESDIKPSTQVPFQQGLNSWGKPGYGGPCPPRGHGPHRYFFKLYALSVDSIELDSSSRIEALLSAIKEYQLGTAELMGIYERK